MKGRSGGGRGKRILVTGGAGFIGSHLADELLENGCEVRVLDNLCEQVHGRGNQRPGYLHREVELVRGDIRDPEIVEKALQGIDCVYHFAGVAGVGQSMYQIVDYTDVNNLGTATLLEALIQRPVERLVVASSMSVYGEGLYRTESGETVMAAERSLEQLKRHEWELRDGEGRTLRPVATPESKPPALASVHALSKFDQERLCLIAGRAYNIPTVALRFFNVYGPRQALSNPHTGVLASFAARLLNDNPPMIFEDGLQQRDFVSVHDVAQACRLALETEAASGQVFNVGSGHHFTVLDAAERMARAMGKEFIEPQITGKHRAGDIRHCFADISEARRVLGYEPRVSFEEGLRELVEWLEGQAPMDRVAQASAELAARGLTV